MSEQNTSTIIKQSSFMSKTIKLVPLQSSTFEPNANIMSDHYNGVILPNSSFQVTPAFVIIYLSTRHTHTACSRRVPPCKRKLDEKVQRYENTNRNGSCRFMGRSALFSDIYYNREHDRMSSSSCCCPRVAWQVSRMTSVFDSHPFQVS